MAKYFFFSVQKSFFCAMALQEIYLPPEAEDFNIICWAVFRYTEPVGIDTLSPLYLTWRDF